MGNTNYALPEYEWLIVVGAFAAILFGYATGANDVANAFATSVGSRALTMRQAVLIAAIFEFVGGMVLGRVSTSVIAKGVASVGAFSDEPQGPQAYAYGMVVALTVGGFWQLWASWAGYNVSATQSIIGGIVGFALVWEGADGVKWAEKDDSGKTFPPYKGVLPIILSWFIAPILTGLASALVFFLCRLLVLRHDNSTKRAMVVLPFAVFLTSWVNIFFVFTKGAKKMLDENSDWSNDKAAWIAAICAIILTVLATAIGIPLMNRSINNTDFSEPAAAPKTIDTEMPADSTIAAPMSAEPVMSAEVHKEEKPQWQQYLTKAKTQLAKGTEYDIHAVVETDPLVAAIHANAEKFDPRAERVFSYLQVFSAICVIFAHGAGEVGYMAGPLTQIYNIVKTGEVDDSSFEPIIWVLALSAGSLVLGLATYGYNVMQAMGTCLAKLTPSRGFSAELSTAMVIMVAAQYGLPTSSSQCITGGIMGVGVLEGAKGLNWLYLFKQLLTWIGTLVVVGLFSAGLFAQAMYTPSKLCDVGN
eukprot:TRINITY_DN15595_c0_g1_i1.p1 TRINITY_DN15595_c0_g1~~TRINITY_DN15595_c0_g1_i1.p1  ORF type:complete len:561 (+),score=203.41 TRINITY_DN15595_c0_g1_i1:92-1684(+)